MVVVVGEATFTRQMFPLGRLNKKTIIQIQSLYSNSCKLISALEIAEIERITFLYKEEA